jgi:hypothetical protein
MKPVIATLILISFCNASNAEVYGCEEHKNTLEVQSEGFEHVNHTVILNGKIRIKELADELWFIEGIECLVNGFVITASHIQYNVPGRKRFLIIVTEKGGYTIE